MIYFAGFSLCKGRFAICFICFGFCAVKNKNTGNTNSKERETNVIARLGKSMYLCSRKAIRMKNTS